MWLILLLGLGMTLTLQVGEYNPDSWLGSALGRLFGGKPKGSTGGQTTETVPPAKPPSGGDPTATATRPPPSAGVVDKPTGSGMQVSERFQPLEGAGEDVYTEQVAGAEDKFVSDVINQQVATDLSRDFQTSVDDILGNIETTRADVETGYESVQAGLEQTRARAAQMPGAVQAEFAKMQGLLEQEIEVGRTDLEAKRIETMGGIMKGRNAALQAATSGLQAKIKSTRSQIDSNIDLPRGMRESMKAQVSIQGHQGLVAAMGPTLAQYDNMMASVGSQFAGFSADLSKVAVGATEALGAAAGNAYAQTEQLVGQIHTTLNQVDAMATGQRNTALIAIEDLEKNAIQTGDQLQLAILPDREEPWIDYSGAEFTRYSLIENTLRLSARDENVSTYLDIMKKAAKQQGEIAKGNILMSLAEFLPSPWNLIPSIWGAGVATEGGGLFGEPSTA